MSTALIYFVEFLVNMTTAQKSLRAVRIIHLGFLGAAVAYLFLAGAYSPSVRKTSPPVVPLAMGIVSLSALGVAVFFRGRMVQPASELLRNNPEDKIAMGHWRGGVLISLVFCESIVLFGFLLKLIGNPWSVCGIFYAVGIFFMLAWWPRLELPPS
jgi:hypothetical protein